MDVAQVEEVTRCRFELGTIKLSIVDALHIVLPHKAVHVPGSVESLPCAF